MLYNSADVRKFCERIATACCPAWRQPGTTVRDSVPLRIDHQTGNIVRDPPSASNFIWWSFERPKGVGLVSHVIIRWGEDCVRDYVNTTLCSWNPNSRHLPVFVEINLNAEKIGVAGNQDQRGSTAYRLRDIVVVELEDLLGGGLWPRHPGFTSFAYRVLIHSKGKK